MNAVGTVRIAGNSISNMLHDSVTTHRRHCGPYAQYLRTLVGAVISAGVSVALPVSASDGVPAMPEKTSGKATNGIYVVRMAESPVIAYDGNIAGYPATRPRKGARIDPGNPQVTRYAAYLDTKHDTAVARVGGRKVYSYHYTFNGFAAELTAAQAHRLRGTAGVLSVDKDEARSIDTSSTPAFLGLAGPSGMWSSLGARGENIIIGIVDGGIWPEHPSFSNRVTPAGTGRPGGKPAYQPIPGWHGHCATGELFNASHCNQKIVGARFYNAAWGGNSGIDAQMPWEFNSARDYDGHGTHTASTAAGNADVTPDGAATVFGPVSGIAPRARIAVYKVCWDTGTGGSCFTSDSVAAIDQAVADGVDVINFSISGSTTNFRDPVEIAFLFAADAGVFVAASAGNSGPATSTVAHPAPWLTTVAASTHNRNGEGSATLGSGTTYAGASLASGLASSPLIDGSAAALPGVAPDAARFCFAAIDNGGVPALDPAKVAGKIVVCDRGVTARTNKSLAVQQAGGVGMILVNTSANSLNADLHAVPSVHLADTARAAVKAYAATAGATASINPATTVYDEPAPFTATFSSRGPLLAANGDLLKPDLIAPGQDILAGVSPAGNNGNLFGMLSGTSMSSPHVAGLAALMKEIHPDWSPMAIKSALMTSAGDVLDGPNTNPLLIFRQGAGHVAPAGAAATPLVFDSNMRDWTGFLCGTQLSPSYCTGAGIPVLDPSDMNLASIAIGDMAGVQTVRRRVTNVSGSSATFTTSYTGLPGLAVTVDPSTLVIAAGETKSFDVVFTRTTATLNTYSGGQLTLSNGSADVRIPVVVRPVALAAPTQVSDSYDVTFGYTGAFSASPRGLVAATVNPAAVADDPTDSSCSLDSPNAALFPVAIDAGTTYARFATFDADVNPGADIDLCVFRGNTLVGASRSATSSEEVSLSNPAAGTYTVVVHGWSVSGSSPFKLHTWLLGTGSAGNMTVTAPASAIIGASGAITLGFSGLTAGLRYLGSVVYGGSAGLPTPTIVRIDP